MEAAINSIFLELPEEKRQKILEAAFAEFGEQGFARASTNRIIKEAGISKGMLFYYFNNKHELFNDLVAIALEHSFKNFERVLSIVADDYFDWLYAVAKAKMGYQLAHPAELRFLGKAYMGGDTEHMDPALKARFEELEQMTRQQLARNIDASSFRPDIPADTIRDMVSWINEGYERSLVARLAADESLWEKNSMERLWEEYYGFLEILRRLFYKEDEQA